MGRGCGQLLAEDADDHAAILLATFGRRIRSRGRRLSLPFGREPRGRNALSEKPIPALAPGFNPASFTDRSKVDGWFKNNCKDVMSRECTMAEKADVLSWLLTLKP
mgnify:CR=1 FL=1